jgi:hypothetical protein
MMCDMDMFECFRTSAVEISMTSELRCLGTGLLAFLGLGFKMAAGSINVDERKEPNYVYHPLLIWHTK